MHNNARVELKTSEYKNNSLFVHFVNKSFSLVIIVKGTLNVLHTLRYAGCFVDVEYSFLIRTCGSGETCLI